MVYGYQINLVAIGGRFCLELVCHQMTKKISCIKHFIEIWAEVQMSRCSALRNKGCLTKTLVLLVSNILWLINSSALQLSEIKVSFM